MDSNKVLRGKGQITLVDITDNLQVEAYISTNLQRQILYNPNKDVYLPNFGNTNMILMPEIIVTGSKENQIANAKSVVWKVKENSQGEWKEITTDLNYTIRDKNLIITSNIMRKFDTVLFAAEIEYQLPNDETLLIYADIELVKLSLGKDGTDGSDSIVGVLSNDSMIFSATSEGKTTSAPQIGNFNIYSGTNKIEQNVLYDFIENPHLDLKIETNGEYAVKWKNTPETLPVVNTEATFTALVVKGTNKLTITKTVSVGKVSLGSSGTTYYLEPSNDIITIDKAGNLVPSNLMVKSRKRDGLNPDEPFFADLVILYSEDNVNYKELSKAENASSISVSVPKSAGSVKVNMYQKETHTLLDSETIPILTYSYPKIDFFITTPMGELILNHEGVLQAEAHLFENGKKVEVVPKWYRRDSGKKTGWEYLKETNILYANAESINSSGVFKAEVVYKGITYYDFVTFSDITDKYQLKILGATTFTQNKGSLDLIGKVYFDGEEIDKDGKKFLYLWTLYDSKGNKVGISRKLNTKEIILHKDEISNIMDLECKIQSTNEYILYQVNRSVSVGNLATYFGTERDISTMDITKPQSVIRNISKLMTKPITTFVRDITKLRAVKLPTVRDIHLLDKDNRYQTQREITKKDSIKTATQRDISLKSFVDIAVVRDIHKTDKFNTVLVRVPSIPDKTVNYQTKRVVTELDKLKNTTQRDIASKEDINYALIREVIREGMTWEELKPYQWQDILDTTWKEIEKDK